MIEKLKLMLKEKEHQSPMRPKKTRTIGLVQDNEAKDLLRKKKTMANHSLLNQPIGETEIRLDLDESRSLHTLHFQQNRTEQLGDESAINDTLCDEDIDVLEDEFVDRVVLKEEDTPFSAFPLYPKFLKVFVQHKLRPVNAISSPRKPSEPSLDENRNRSFLEPAINIQSFQMNRHRIGENLQSNSFYTHILETLLHIQKPED